MGTGDLIHRSDRPERAGRLPAVPPSRRGQPVTVASDHGARCGGACRLLITVAGGTRSAPAPACCRRHAQTTSSSTRGQASMTSPRQFPSLVSPKLCDHQSGLPRRPSTVQPSSAASPLAVGLGSTRPRRRRRSARHEDRRLLTASDSRSGCPARHRRTRRIPPFQPRPRAQQPSSPKPRYDALDDCPVPRR
jgi:hypothetical protein